MVSMNSVSQFQFGISGLLLIGTSYAQPGFLPGVTSGNVGVMLPGRNTIFTVTATLRVAPTTSLTITLLVDMGATAATISISGLATSGTWTGSPITVQSTQLVTIQVTPVIASTATDLIVLLGMA